MANTFQKWYNDIHPRYELSNHILTFGLDVLWRKRAAETALQFNRGKSLDVCSGTGDFVYELYRRSENGEAVFACDLTLNMLKRAERRAPEKRIQCAVSEAGALPFPDNTFDFASVTFATRNLNTSRQALTDRFADIRRVLLPSVCENVCRPDRRICKRIDPGIQIPRSIDAAVLPCRRACRNSSERRLLEGNIQKILSRRRRAPHRKKVIFVTLRK